jgi:proline dehydrogenase
MGAMGTHEVEEGLRGASPPQRVGSTWLAALRRRGASAYRAGSSIDEALDACRRLAAHGVASTIGYAARAGESARHVADRQLAAFSRLAAEELDCYVSVKLSALGFDAALFAELEAAAARSARRLHLDALAPDAVDAIWSLLERSPRHGALGTTLPGRWQGSAADASRVAELGLAARVVKGQWACEPPGRADPARGFLQVIDRLGGSTAPVAVATHDVGLLTESLRRLTACGTRCEAELFYGLPFRAPALAARRLGVPIRVYVPYGDGGAPYDVADLVRKPIAAAWLAQDLLLGKEKMWRSIRRSKL